MPDLKLPARKKQSDRHFKPNISPKLMFGWMPLIKEMNHHKEASDVDIALKGHRVSIDISNKVHSLLEETNLPFFFDVLNYNTLNNEELKYQIDRQGIQFYTNHN